MFDGTLGYYTGSQYKIELLDGAKPYSDKPNPNPKIYVEIFKTEVNRLIKIGVLKRKDNSKWAAPNLIIPKLNGIVRYISDFRELNNRITKKSFQFLKCKICY